MKRFDQALLLLVLVLLLLAAASVAFARSDQSLWEQAAERVWGMR